MTELDRNGSISSSCFSTIHTLWRDKANVEERDGNSKNTKRRFKMVAQPPERHILSICVMIAHGMRTAAGKKICQTHDKEVTSVLAHLFHFEGRESL